MFYELFMSAGGETVDRLVREELQVSQRMRELEELSGERGKAVSTLSPVILPGTVYLQPKRYQGPVQ
jgi:hypothetical protein